MNSSQESLKCAFSGILESCSEGEKQFATKFLTFRQICTVTKASEERSDRFTEMLGDKDNLNYHSSCYMSYTSKSRIEQAKKRLLKAKEAASMSSPPTKRLRSRFLNIYC